VHFAYADPPYFGQGKRRYGAPEWDKRPRHLELLAELEVTYPDGFALSCNPANLTWLLPAATRKVRVCAWVKPYRQLWTVGVQYSWEPVLLVGGHADPKRRPMVVDWLLCKPTRKRGLCGANPALFNHWILDLLGYVDGDTLDDLYPGTNGMAVALDGHAEYLEGLAHAA